jgi:hypothetical protein
VDTVIGSNSLDDYGEVPIPDFEPDDMKKEYFAFYPEQHEIVVQALAAAQGLSGSTVKSNNLHLICLDFLASNDDGRSTKKQKLRRLTQIAQGFGYDLVIVDDGDVVFGLETLEKLAGT